MINISFVGAIILVGWFGIKFVDENIDSFLSQLVKSNLQNVIFANMILTIQVGIDT